MARDSIEWLRLNQRSPFRPPAAGTLSAGENLCTCGTTFIPRDIAINDFCASEFHFSSAVQSAQNLFDEGCIPTYEEETATQILQTFSIKIIIFTVPALLSYRISHSLPVTTSDLGMPSNGKRAASNDGPNASEEKAKSTWTSYYHLKSSLGHDFCSTRGSIVTQSTTPLIFIILCLYC